MALQQIMRRGHLQQVWDAKTADELLVLHPTIAIEIEVPADCIHLACPHSGGTSATGQSTSSLLISAPMRFINDRNSWTSIAPDASWSKSLNTLATLAYVAVRNVESFSTAAHAAGSNPFGAYKASHKILTNSRAVNL